MDRRTVLRALAGAPLLSACRSEPPAPRVEAPSAKEEPELVTRVAELASPWQTPDPFLFCVHHNDAYPAGNEKLGPVAALSERSIGNDFAGKDGWNMYHGDVVPGFPQHPHRGFETITVVRRGLVDHADSLGAAARYGDGDVQWLTAGRGIVHAEMFPLLSRDADNPLDLFQIWLNLPKKNKFVEPHFSMLWGNSIPRRALRDREGRTTELSLIAGRFGDAAPPAPPPNSWASDPTSDMLIATLKFEPGARFTLPRARPGTNRMLYFFSGKNLTVGGREIDVRHAVELRADLDAPIENGAEVSELLVLQGRPIGEPIAKRGPFVMNEPDEIRQAYADYRATRFGGWPWPSDGPVHGNERARFARHADGRIEQAT
jgi:redox-sensitive bicupin YhaK (pirin superfamily)